jgi:hypothetical protein
MLTVTSHTIMNIDDRQLDSFGLYIYIYIHVYVCGMFLLDKMIMMHQQRLPSRD